MEIRPLREGDEVLAAELMHRVISVLSFYTEEARKAEIDKYSPKTLLDLSTKDPHSVLLAWEGDEAVGFAVNSMDNGPVWLHWFGVVPENRKKGIGHRLLHAVETAARTRGAHKVWCDTRTDNSASISVLAAMNYIPVARLNDHWFGQDYFLWEKSLRAFSQTWES
jgi:GNAT superfamily N-acetyltransferase